MMEQSLSLTQKQTLKLNTQMIQSLELMTLPLAELQAKIENELLENPTLHADDSLSHISYEEYVKGQIRGESHTDSYSDSSAYGSDLSDSHQAWLEGALSSRETLEEHLMKQLGSTQCSDDVRETASLIISSLDENGFYPSDLDSLLPDRQKEYRDEALTLLHSFDPSGVCARDFRDSLVIQAQNLGLEGDELEVFRRMVYGELDTLRSGKFDEAARRLHVEKEDVEALYGFLKTLTPYPASLYSSGYDHYIEPDLSIKVEDGKLTVKLNSSALPLLSIDKDYEEMAKELAGSRNPSEKETCRYLKKEMQDAGNLIRQVDLRNTTLEKVANVLALKQKAFFLFGPGYLKPLTLRDVASQIGVHEATVSRITTSKYADTDWGIISLKSLFSSAVRTSGGDEELSKEAVKEMVRKIIEDNSGGKPLSDQKISDMLKEKGISCARRTVNKYRKELNIDSSFERGR